MSKRKRASGKSSKAPPKRTRKRGSQEQAVPNSKASPAQDTPKAHVSPLIATLILTPLIGILLYGGYLLIRAGDPSDTPADLPDESVASQPENPQLTTTAKLNDASTGQWQTEACLSDKWERLDDPSGDGWNTEVFNERITAQFKAIQKKLHEPAKLDSNSLKSLVASDVSVGVLRPDQPEMAWQDSEFQVYRATAKDADISDGGNDRKSMAATLQTLVSKYVDPSRFRSKIKVFRIEESEDYIDTWQTVELYGETKRGLEEENMVWRSRWQLDETGKIPLLSQVTYEKYEGIVRPGRPLFSDCTESILSGNPRFKSQLLVGYNQILQRCQVNDYYLTLGNPGLALGDVNNDGLDDLFVCQENGVPNMLFLRNADGSLTDFTDECGANWLQNCRTALIVDLNNDGNNDLAVAYTGGVVVASGDGTGRFQLRKYLPTSGDVLALSAADYDLDGRLDLFVGVYGADGALMEQQQLTAAGAGGDGFVYVDAKDGGKNSLFRNQCDKAQWQFEDVTVESGLDAFNHRYTQAAAWGDVDNDGDPDLYVANDYGPNNLFRNDVNESGVRTFTDIAKSAGAQDSASGMSVDWADFDRDGWQDIYVGNMYSYAGNRIAFQNQFKPNQSSDVIEKFQRFARGNTLLRNPGYPNSSSTDTAPSTFEDQSLTAAVNRGRWSWGSRFVDLNNDGWQDLVVANGFITAEDSGDL